MKVEHSFAAKYCFLEETLLQKAQKNSVYLNCIEIFCKNKKSLQTLLINVMQPCWIKVLISLKISKYWTQTFEW